MVIRLLCTYGIVASTGKARDRYIICVGGSHQCAKSENQGIFDEYCFVVEEIVK